jgi:predicted RNase H-like HicB family nuclease
MPETIAYPLIFSFSELLSSSGFLAGVKGRARAIMVREDDGAWWMYGVEPGGLAESGDTPQEAHIKFAEAFRGVLFDIASDSATLPDFEKALKKFFHEIDREDADRWEKAATAIRAGSLVPEPPFSSLPKQPAESPPFISVQRVEMAASLPSVEAKFESHLPTAAAAA